MGTGILVGMAVVTVASGVTQGIMNSLGKQTESGYIDLFTKSSLAITALATFAKFISALKGLG